MSNFLTKVSRFIGRSLFLLNILVAVWLLGCLAAGLVSPLQSRYLPVLSLTTPFAVLANLIFIFIWLFLSSRKIRVILSVVVLIAAYPVELPLFGWNLLGANEEKEGPDKIKVMLWNVHGLGIYDRPVKKTTPRDMMEEVIVAAPDILCMVEFYTDYKDAMKPHSLQFLQKGKFKEFRFVWDAKLGKKIYIGLALFSKYPVHNVQEIALSKGIKLLQADLDLPQAHTLRVFLLHLESVHLSDKDKSTIEELQETEGQTQRKISSAKTYINRLTEHYQVRARQADSVRMLIRNSPYPVLVCGDFNDMPGSYSYFTVRGDLKDAFVEKGLGIGRTYNKLSPTLRIDDIFYDPKLLRCTGFDTHSTELSDHNFITATFRYADSLRQQ